MDARRVSPCGHGARIWPFLVFHTVRHRLDRLARWGLRACPYGLGGGGSAPAASVHWKSRALHILSSLASSIMGPFSLPGACRSHPPSHTVLSQFPPSLSAAPLLFCNLPSPSQSAVLRSLASLCRPPRSSSVLLSQVPPPSSSTASFHGQLRSLDCLDSFSPFRLHRTASSSHPRSFGFSSPRPSDLSIGRGPTHSPHGIRRRFRQ
jgi:hypothetical protein